MTGRGTRREFGARKARVSQGVGDGGRVRTQPFGGKSIGQSG